VYNLSQFAPELPFCIVVPSFNNTEGNRHFKNMRSILMQEYKNYHIVFIDDASTDGAGVQIEAMLRNQTILPSYRYVIVKNAEQRRAMPNLRMAAFGYCKAEEIFLIVDGDD
jgi:glycosyltransferase involved in cell wall biosynthesis